MARWIEVAALALLAWSLAVPVPYWFAGLRWPARAPVGGLLVWQAIGLAGGLAVLTAELTLAATGRTGSWRQAVAHTLDAPTSVGALGALGLTLLAVSTCWLLAVLAASFARVRRSRAAHRRLVELLCTPVEAHGTRVDLLEETTPFAYSLPGREPHVVVSTAARADLDGDQLSAVLAHERAHLRQRHSILLQPFIAWEQSLPFLRAPGIARRRVEQLVEMVCDDAACRTCEPHSLVGALALLAPPSADVDERLARLPDSAAVRRPAVLRAVLATAALAIVVLPPIVLLTLAV